MGDPQHKMDQFSLQESLNQEKTSYSDVVTDSNTDMVTTSPGMGGGMEQSDFIVQAMLDIDDAITDNTEKLPDGSLWMQEDQMNSLVEKEEEEKDSKKADLERQPLYIQYQNSPDDILSISSGSDWSPATPVENTDYGEHRIDSLRMSANFRKIAE